LCPHHPNPLTHTHIWCNLSRIDWLISLIMIQFMFVSLPSRLHPHFPPFLFSPSPKNYYRDFVLFCLSLLFFNIFCSSLFRYFMFVIWSCRIYSCTWWCSNYYFNQVYVSTITLLTWITNLRPNSLADDLFTTFDLFKKKKTIGLLRRWKANPRTMRINRNLRFWSSVVGQTKFNCHLELNWIVFVGFKLLY
jgi:hypothetical protein